jgi:hypothetical protein
VVTVSPQVEQITIPYCTVATFTAHPTYLDLMNLRSGDSSAAHQAAELFNVLLMASAKVDDWCEQPIHAHIKTDTGRLRPNRYGRLYLNPHDTPVRTVLSVSYQTSLFQAPTVVTTPAVVIEHEGKQVGVDLGYGTSGMTWTGPLQLSQPITSSELEVSSVYVAGYGNTVLTNNPAQGATSIQVANPTGIFAGDVLRIWEPGAEESVVVDASWAGQNTFPYTSATIPLAAGLANAHTSGTGVAGFSPNVTMATIYFAIDGLQRWGVTSSEWPGSRVSTAAGKGKPMELTPWEEQALYLLDKFRRVR